MAQYIYKAKKGPDEIISGEMNAESQDHVVNHLTGLGLVPISIVEKGKAIHISSAGKPSAAAPINVHPDHLRLSSKSINIFTRQLSSMVKAGVPLLRALTLISQQTDDAKLQKLVGDLEKQIREGKMLSEALARYPKIFNNLYVNLIKAGEKSGALGEVLNNLLEYREKEQDVHQRVQAALAYPLLTAVVGVFTVFFMLTFCMPKLLGLFENMRRELPISTKILIQMSHFMSAHWYWFVIIFIFLMIIFGSARQGSKKKAVLDYLKLNVPIINKFVKDTEVAKSSRTLSLLIKNGLSVYSSLDMATDVLDNMMLKESLKKVRLEISSQGSTLSGSLRKSKALPNFVVNMIAVGEEGSKLDHVLREVANHYEKEVDQGIKVITSLLEPIFILVIGGIVGFIVMSMLLPIFDIGTSIR